MARRQFKTDESSHGIRVILTGNRNASMGISSPKSEKKKKKDLEHAFRLGVRVEKKWIIQKELQTNQLN